MSRLVMALVFFSALLPAQPKEKQKLKTTPEGSRPGPVAATIAARETLKQNCKAEWADEACQEANSTVKTSGGAKVVPWTRREDDYYEITWTCPEGRAQSAVHLVVNASNNATPPRRYRLEAYEDCRRNRFRWSAAALQALNAPNRITVEVTLAPGEAVLPVKLSIPREPAAKK